MARNRRLTVTLSPQQIVALDLLGERNGMGQATQCRVLLAQSLYQTLVSKECQRRLSAAGLSTEIETEVSVRVLDQD